MPYKAQQYSASSLLFKLQRDTLLDQHLMVVVAVQTSFPHGIMAGFEQDSLSGSTPFMLYINHAENHFQQGVDLTAYTVPVGHFT